jgi:hypothetical protein
MDILMDLWRLIRCHVPPESHGYSRRAVRNRHQNDAAAILKHFIDETIEH